MSRKWNEMGYEHLQMQVFAQNLSDRVAKAERVSKTLRDHIKEQHMLSEIAENSNPIQESGIWEWCGVRDQLMEMKTLIQSKSCNTL